MASLLSILKNVLNLNCMHIYSCETDTISVSRNHEMFEQQRIIVHARPYRRLQSRCPKCGSKCSGYDTRNPNKETTWRAPNLHGVPVLIRYTPQRIRCPEHGGLTEDIPWSDGDSHFTESFNNEVAWLAMQMNKTAVSDFVGINWRTVGNCINAAWKRLEPDVSTRLHGLKRICVDETGSRKGYEYITVVYDMDRNRVVWVNEGVGRDVFEQFCLLLSPEERSKIEIIAGDGARWIDSCMKEYFPGATRCIDFFHVVEWANEALDKVRIDTAKKALKEYEKLREDLLREEAERRIEQSKLRIAYIVARSELDSMPQRGRPSKRKNELQAYISELESLINPINLQAGYMSDELLPEHRELIINYAQLNRQSDADESDLAKARQALTEALTEAEKIFASRTFRGRPSAKVQRIMNFISLFGPVDKQWNASGKAGRPRKDNLSLDHQRRVDEYKARAVGIKGSKHALGHRPEKCTESQRDKIKLIENSYPELYRAYQLKESLRLILQMKDHEMAKNELDKWLSEVSECSIRPMKDLAGKIERHYTNILNSVKCQANSAKSESANTTIKAMIRVARGFRNINNLIAFIYLKCSDLVIPLNNRYQPTAEKSAEMRARDNELRRRREKKRQEAYHQAKTA